MKVSVLYYRWTAVEANGGDVIFNDPYAEDPNVTFTNQGRYTLRLTASDGQASGFDETVIVVGEPSQQLNQSPTVEIIDNQGPIDGVINITTLSSEPAVHTFDANALDPDSVQLTYTWSLVPDANTPVNGVSFDDIHDADPNATFTEQGTYQVQVEVSDGQYSAYDTITVTVNPYYDFGFTVDAGWDKEIKLPAMAYLLGSYDPYWFNENDLEVRWYLLDGPALVNFIDDSENQLYAKAAFTEPGTYTFRLEGQYGLLEDVDDVKIVVKQGMKIVNSGHNQTLLIDDSAYANLWSCGQNFSGLLGQPIVGDNGHPLPCDCRRYADGSMGGIENQSSYFGPVLPADQIDADYPLNLVLQPDNIFMFLGGNVPMEQFNTATITRSTPLIQWDFSALLNY